MEEAVDLERPLLESEPIIQATLDEDAETTQVESLDNKGECRWWIWFIPCSLLVLLLLGGYLWIRDHIITGALRKRYQARDKNPGVLPSTKSWQRKSQLLMQDRC